MDLAACTLISQLLSQLPLRGDIFFGRCVDSISSIIRSSCLRSSNRIVFLTASVVEWNEEQFILEMSSSIDMYE